MQKIESNNIGKILTIFKWLVVAVVGSFVALVVWGIAGYESPFSDTEITNEQPFADYIGREYRIKSQLSAYAWNDFPDKSKILTISLEPTPLYRSRFVSDVKELPAGQKVQILSAWKHFALVEFSYYYLVSIPGSDLLAGVPIRMKVTSGACPDPALYEPIND